MIEEIEKCRENVKTSDLYGSIATVVAVFFLVSIFSPFEYFLHRNDAFEMNYTRRK